MRIRGLICNNIGKSIYGRANDARAFNTCPACQNARITRKTIHKKCLNKEQAERNRAGTIRTYNSRRKIQLYFTSVIELAKNAYNLFKSSDMEERRQLINFISANLTLEGRNLHFTYRKLFDIIAKGVSLLKMAPRAGLEPATLELTALCSAIELPGKNFNYCAALSKPLQIYFSKKARLCKYARRARRRG